MNSAERADDELWAVTEHRGWTDNRYKLHSLCRRTYAHQFHFIGRILDRVFNTDPHCINRRDEYGLFPLLSVTFWVGNDHVLRYAEKQKDIVSWLLDHNADVNAISSDGWIPLAGALWAHNYSLARLLVLHGANARSDSLRRKLADQHWNNMIKDIEEFYTRVQQRIDSCRRCAAALLSAPVLARTGFPRDLMREMILEHIWPKRRFHEEWEK